jgi:hypothetical protein
VNLEAGGRVWVATSQVRWSSAHASDAASAPDPSKLSLDHVLMPIEPQVPTCVPLCTVLAGAMDVECAYILGF